jgi:hypothetical protein
LKGFLLLSILLAVEVTNKRMTWNVSQLQRPALRITMFAAVLWLIALFGTFSSNSFIYFQF